MLPFLILKFMTNANTTELEAVNDMLATIGSGK